MWMEQRGHPVVASTPRCGEMDGPRMLSYSSWGAADVAWNVLVIDGHALGSLEFFRLNGARSAVRQI